MKKLFSALLTVVILVVVFTQTVLAAEAQPREQITALSTAEVIQPRGSLSGYGQHWYNSGESKQGTFSVNVTGIYWPTAQLTLSLDNFSSDVCVQVIVYRPNGTIAFNTANTNAVYMTMANSSEWHNIGFANGQTGTYTVWYSIWSTNSSIPSSGRINCWIY